MDSPEPLPKAIFRFLNLSKINIALREEEPKLNIIMFSNPTLSFVVSVTHWERLGELDRMYCIKTTTTRHQCLTRSTTWGFPNDYLNPNTSSKKIIAWKVVLCKSNLVGMRGSYHWLTW